MCALFRMIPTRMNRLLRVIPLVVVLIATAMGVGACGTQKIHIPSSDPTYKSDVAAAQIFNERCGGCHTLSYAGTRGSAANPRTAEAINGPNFNVTCMRPAIRVLYAIENGGFSGAYMPQNIVVGQQAREVAMFVSKFAGRQAVIQPGTTACSKQAIGTLPPLTAPAQPIVTGVPTTPSAPSAGPTTKLSLAVATNGMLMFDKKALTAPAGNVQITLTNSTAIPHNVTVQVGTSGKVLGATPTFAKSSKTVTLNGLTAGTYTFYCSVPGHRQAGMVGTLTITGKGGSSSTSSSTTTTSTSSTTTSTSASSSSGALDLVSAPAGLSTAPGEAVFKSTCGACHTLAATGSTGTVGPNLDQLKPSYAIVAHQVENGGGIMPSFAHTLSVTQIESVAKYVSTVAGTVKAKKGAAAPAGNGLP
jgi:mono/diheme cytochrome c family protein